MITARNLLAIVNIAMVYLAFPGLSHAVPVELLPDVGFENPLEIGETDALWNDVNGALPTPTVNAMSSPRSGLEHAELILDTNQLFGAFGPTIRSTSFAGFGPAVGVSDFTGMTLSLTNNYRVTAFNMNSPDPAVEPSVLVRTYLAYFSETFGFLGFGGFEGEVFPSDVFPESVSADYEATSYSTVVPSFGTPVTSVDFTFGLVAPDTEMGQMTGTATVIFDDVSLIADLPPTADYNENGVVDAADYVLWRKSLGMSGIEAFELGDGDGNGDVTEEDYFIWRDQFGAQIGSGSSATFAATTAPEPCSLFVLTQLIAMQLIRRKSRRFKVNPCS